MYSFLALVLAVTAATPVLTLDEALAEARQKNLELKAARARLTQAEQASRKAWAGYLPHVVASGAYTRNSFEVGFPGEAEALTLQPLNQLSGQVELRQALFVPTLWSDIQAASQAEQVATLETEAQRREVLFLVAQAYYGAAAQQEALRAQERLLELNQERERQTRARFDAGTVMQVALLRAQLDRTRAEQDLVRARNALAATKLALATLLQRDADFELVPPPEPRAPLQEADLASQALELRPDVAAAREGVELARIQRSGVGWSYLPALGLSAAYRVSNAAAFTGDTTAWWVTVGASWTLWDGGLREALLRERSGRVAETEALRDAAEARTREEVARMRLELESALANRAKAQEALALARETQRLTDVGFRSGAATYLEVADANAALTSAEVGFVAERLHAALAALRLAKAVGVFEASPPAMP